MVDKKKWQKVLLFQGSEELPLIGSDNLELVTMMECVLAVGDIIPPFCSCLKKDPCEITIIICPQRTLEGIDLMNIFFALSHLIKIIL